MNNTAVGTNICKLLHLTKEQIMEHTWQQFVEEYEQWVWDNWPTAAEIAETNRELRELSNE